MRRKRDPVPRAKDAWVWLGGLLLLGFLGAGVTAAAVMLWENVDIRQLTPGLVRARGALPEPEPAAPAAVDLARFTAVLFASQRNRAYFADERYYDAELDRWRALILDVGGDVREATDARALNQLATDELLVLAESPCLSRPELAAIRRHVSRGGNVVSNWAIGVRDAECTWRGWDPLLELTGAAGVQELPSRQGLFMTVPGGIALSVGFDPGTRIELRPDPSLALRAAGARVYWSDWALNPAPDETGFGADVAAAVSRTPAGGRSAWFGFRVGQAATPTDSLHLRRLVQNGVLWAAGTSFTSLAAWPGGARAALVLSLDVEDQSRNAIDFAALLEREGLPGTFFAVSELVASDDDLAEALARAGEVASQTADHTPLGGLTAQDQGVRLRRSWRDIERWIGRGPTGLRPPEEAFDSTTVRAWREVGGRYILARNESRSASPEIHPTDGGPIVLLPRLLKDDYNVIVQDGTLRAGRLAEAYVEGTRKVRAIGGLAVVAGHTQIMNSGRRLAAFSTVGASARADGDWWIASAEDVATWWRARASTDVRFVPAASSSFDPSISPSGLSDIVVRSGEDGGSPHDLWLDVALPVGGGGLIPLVDGRSVRFAATEWGIRIPVGPLESGEERRVSLVLVDPGESLPAGG